MLDGARRQHDVAAAARLGDAPEHVRSDDPAEDRDRPLRVPEQPVDRGRQVRPELVERAVPWSVSMPASGSRRFWGVVHIWPLYSDSENARLRSMPSVVVGGVDDDAVHARLLREHDGLCRVRLEPRPEGARAREVDQPDVGSQREAGSGPVARRVDGQRDDVGREAGLGEHLAGDGDRDRERQHGAPRRLDEDRVPGREAGEQPRVAVPGREGRAPDQQRDAARDDPEGLRHPQRRTLALGLLPGRRHRDAAHRRAGRSRPPRGPGPARASRRPGTPSGTPGRSCASRRSPSRATAR